MAAGPNGVDGPDSVAVCVATCRRPQLLRRTLESLAGQRLERVPGAQLEVHVVDNDTGGEGMAVVEALGGAGGGFPFPIAAYHEPSRGIPFARNRLVRESRDTRYVAFIDDDETAHPDWLQELLIMARRSRATAVLGPVGVHFEGRPAPWLRSLFEDIVLADGATLPDGFFRTSSVLIRRDALRDVPGPFDPAFALTGGSDYMLGQRLLAGGAHFVWAAHARVTETIPSSRANLSWYLRRRYRTGSTYAKVQVATRGPIHGRARSVYRAAGSLAVAARDLARALPGNRAAMARSAGLFCYGVGNVAGATGVRYDEYRTIHGS